ncbi:MAG: TetR family transcriptional regulator [Acidobacteria bacterium]|nr:MAG: TetR family transcriptional regulator [Acidobacteriota bacterium]
MARKQSYHHGNLREALLKAAIGLIAEVGPTAFTLREVARRAGVSHNAPYRHFRAKEDLIAAVATEGFIELKRAMLRETRRKITVRDRLKYSGIAYVHFAIRHPEHFAIMFDAPLPSHRDSELQQASDEAFQALMNFVKECQDEKALPSGDPYQFALLAWSLVHGIAKLAITKRLPYRSKTNVLKFAEFVIDDWLLKRR